MASSDHRRREMTRSWARISYLAHGQIYKPLTTQLLYERHFQSDLKYARGTFVDEYDLRLHFLIGERNELYTDLSP